MFKPPWALPLLMLIPGLSTSAHAAEPEERLVYRNLSVFRLNPLGLIDIGEVNYRHRLYDSESFALKDNFFGVGLAPSASPAFARLGIVAEVQPASFLRLWGSYEFVRYFGLFNFLQSFPSATSDFSDSTLKARGALPDGDPAQNYAASGRQLNLGATLQLKAGPVALRSLARLMYADFKLRTGDRVFYDILFDILAPNRGWYLNADTELLWLTDFGLAAGIRYTVGHAWYGTEHFAPGEDTSVNPSYPFHRLGPMVAYSFWKDRGGAFDNPTVLLVMNWWVQHRYRTGEDVPQGMPFLILGFSFTGDLTPANW